MTSNIGHAFGSRLKSIKHIASMLHVDQPFCHGLGFETSSAQLAKIRMSLTNKARDRINESTLMTFVRTRGDQGEYTPPLSLCEFLNLVGTSQCADVRDKVFALIPLATDGDWFMADYRLDATRIYQQLVQEYNTIEYAKESLRTLNLVDCRHHEILFSTLLRIEGTTLLNVLCSRPLYPSALNTLKRWRVPENALVCQHQSCLLIHLHILSFLLNQLEISSQWYQWQRSLLVSILMRLQYGTKLARRSPSIDLFKSFFPVVCRLRKENDLEHVAKHEKPSGSIRDTRTTEKSPHAYLCTIADTALTVIAQSRASLSPTQLNGTLSSLFEIANTVAKSSPVEVNLSFWSISNWATRSPRHLSDIDDRYKARSLRSQYKKALKKSGVLIGASVISSDRADLSIPSQPFFDPVSNAEHKRLVKSWSCKQWKEILKIDSGCRLSEFCFAGTDARLLTCMQYHGSDRPHLVLERLSNRNFFTSSDDPLWLRALTCPMEIEETEFWPPVASRDDCLYHYHLRAYSSRALKEFLELISDVQNPLPPALLRIGGIHFRASKNSPVPSSKLHPVVTKEKNEVVIRATDVELSIVRTIRKAYTRRSMLHEVMTTQSE